MERGIMGKEKKREREGREERERENARTSIMPCKYGSSLGPPGMECINPLMHMGPVKLDSARFSWKCDISVPTEFPATTRVPRGRGRGAR